MKSSNVQDAIIPLSPQVLSSPLVYVLVGVANKNRFTNFSWAFRSRGRTAVTEIALFGDVARHSWALRISQLHAHFVMKCHTVNSSQKSQLCRLYLR